MRMEIASSQTASFESEDLDGDGMITENEISRWKLIAVGK